MTASPALSSRTSRARSARSTGWHDCRATKIRERFEERFTARRMAQDYLAVYRSLMETEQPHLRLGCRRRADQSQHPVELTATNGGQRLLFRSAVFRHQQPAPPARPTAAIARQPEEGDLAAEMIGHVAGQRGAERRADPGRVPMMPCAKIEAAGAARDIGDHQRHHDAEHRGGDAVEHLNGDDQVRIGDRSKQQAADRQRGECR